MLGTRKPALLLSSELRSGSSHSHVRDDEISQVRPLTTPHIPVGPEKKRIENLGGMVSANRRVFGRLAMSRSFGDAHFKTPQAPEEFVIAEPDIDVVPLSKEHRLVFRSLFLLILLDT